MVRRRWLALFLLLLLLPGCAKKSEPVPEQNINEVDIYREELMNVKELTEGYITGFDERKELSAKELPLLLQELQTRLGKMTAPVANIPATGPVEPVEGYEDAELYRVGLSYQRKDGTDNVWIIYFLIDGENTPQAFWTRIIGSNARAWYTFDDPEAFVSIFWE